MSNSKRIIPTIAALLLLAGCNTPDSAGVSTLVIDASDFERMPNVIYRGIVNDGPLVSIVSPLNGSIYTEADQIMVDVLFDSSAEGVPADMDTLEVIVKKGWFGKNITDDLAEYIAGNRLFAESISMAGYTGNFKFEISVEDTTGRRTQQIFEIRIAK